MRVAAWMVTCPERAGVCAETLAALGETDWGEPPELVRDEAAGPTSLARIHGVWGRALERAAASDADLAVLFEDDLRFATHLRESLLAWGPLSGRDARGYFFGSLYDPNRIPRQGVDGPDYFVAMPRFVWGAQALVMTPRTVRYVLSHWGTETGNPDERMPRIASRIVPIFYHVPSLIDHVGASTWDANQRHWAPNFDPAWRAAGAGRERRSA